MKRTLVIILVLILTLCLCACAEKKEETEQKPTETEEEAPTKIVLTIGGDEVDETEESSDDNSVSDAEKVPIGDIQNPNRVPSATQEEQTLPTLTWPEIPEPEPVEPETEVASS